MANSRVIPSAIKSGWARLWRAAASGVIPFFPALPAAYVVKCVVRVRGGAAFLQCSTGSTVTETALAAATSQNLELHTVAPKLLFPADVRLLRGASVRVRANTTGTTTATITVGDAGDRDGLTTVSNLHTGTVGRRIITPGAAEYEEHHEPAFEPSITLASTGANLSALTAGAFDIRIPFVHEGN